VFVVRRRRGTEFLKIGRDLGAEHARLMWLAPRISVPEVLAFVPGDVDHLLLSGLPGSPADRLAHEREPIAVIGAMAAAARAFHALARAECPFHGGSDGLFRRAEVQVATGRVRREDLGSTYQHWTPEDLLTEAAELMPTTQDLVVTHGDLCLPNVLLDREASAAFVDVGAVELGDRFRDLSLLDRSVVRNLGERWRGAIYYEYGIARDPARERFFLLIDQLLMARATQHADRV
jgi:aminoglycoside phosphotransferase